MSIIIINSHNSSSALCSLLRTRLNDASVTMLFAEAGMIFGVPQNNNSVLHVSFMFISPQLSLITFKW